MKVYQPEHIRNIALISHGGAGKTSLVDAALYDSGAVTRMGRVDEGTSQSDFDPDEIKRRMSINCTLIPVEWRDTKINFLDTPGYADFVGEMKSGLRAADAALVVVTAEKGVEVGTETVWKFADEQHLPRLVFINKLDRENASFMRTVESLQAQFGKQVTPAQMPIGEQADLRGIIDLISLRAFTFNGTETQETTLPAELREQAEALREQLIETAIESDDDLMTRYLEGEELSTAEIRQVIRAAIVAGSLVPILCGSATRNIGIQTLLDAIVDYAPNPLEVHAPGTEELLNGQPAALVFKTIADPQRGRISYLRVYSGTVSADSHLFNVQTNTDERIGQIFIPRGKQQETTTELQTGDIGAVVKLQNTRTGDTLTTREHPVQLPPVDFPEPLFTAAITPKTKTDLDKMGNALARIVEEDPSIRISRDPDTGVTLISGMGESHVDIIIERMQRKYGVAVEKSDPPVPYRETIRKPAKAQGRHKRQTGGHGQFGDVHLEIEPLPVGGPEFEFENRIVGGVVPKEYIPSVEKGVRDFLKRGFLAGYPMIHVKVALVFGSYHPVDSSGQSFEIAASLGMQKAVAEASPTLLEPILLATIVVPEAYMGDVIGDLNTKRARILGMEPLGNGLQQITAQVPMAEMIHYATDLRSITQGRGSFKTEFYQYEEVPANLQQQIIEQAKARKEAEASS
jgi:elongation factor G